MARSLLMMALQDISIAAFRQAFGTEGYWVDSAQTFERGMGMLAMRHYDAVLLFGRSAASLSGVVEQLRRHTSPQQIIIACVALSSPDEENRVLTAGATLCRPASIATAELLAHVRALLRRAHGYPCDYRVGDLGIDPVARRASRNGKPLRLRPIEFDILLLLAEGAGKPIDRKALLSRIWPHGEGSANLLAAHMHNLRSAIDQGYRPRRCIQCTRAAIN